MGSYIPWGNQIIPWQKCCPGSRTMLMICRKMMELTHRSEYYLVLTTVTNIQIDSHNWLLKLISYGPRWVIFIQNPGHIWKYMLDILSYPGNVWQILLLYVLISWTYLLNDFQYVLGILDILKAFVAGGRAGRAGERGESMYRGGFGRLLRWFRGRSPPVKTK